MAETTPSAPVGLTRGQEEAAFYHEAALNSAWTGARLLIGVVTSGLGAFVFAFFYLRSVNNYGLWYPKGFTGPQGWEGAVIVIAIVVSAVAQSLGLQQLKRGKKSSWLAMSAAALMLGVVAVVFLILQLATLPFQPGSSGFSSVFTDTYPALAGLFVSSYQAGAPLTISFDIDPTTAVAGQVTVSASNDGLAWALILAGASMVSIGTAIFHDPSACARILRELDDELARRGIERLSQVTGVAHEARTASRGRAGVG